MPDEELRTIDAAILQRLFWIYFKARPHTHMHTRVRMHTHASARARTQVLKMGKASALLPPTLRGLSTFGHLINIDFFGDILNAMTCAAETGRPHARRDAPRGVRCRHCRHGFRGRRSRSPSAIAALLSSSLSPSPLAAALLLLAGLFVCLFVFLFVLQAVRLRALRSLQDTA